MISLLKSLKMKRWRKIIKDSGFFDEKHYLFTNSDVRAKDIDPIDHYLRFGANEGRNPSALFNTKYYLQENPDVAENEFNPLMHYILFGQKENRKIAPIKTKNNNVSHQIPIKSLDPSVNNFDYFDFCFSLNSERSTHYKEFENRTPIETDIKLIAFYLPQFHPFDVNDKAWGKGFTEWTNVSKAIPQFEDHYQPRLPGELGYYDLRLLEVQKRQIELAKNYGLYGFCYHYYWFDGQKVMDKPLQNILDNPDLDFPFCINWANENWTKRWDGLNHEVILTQNHTAEDDIAFLEAIKPILTDSRYIKIDAKALLMVYRPQLFPDIKATVKRWRKHAKKIGIGELYLVLSHSFDHQDPRSIGFDAATEFAPNNFQVQNLTQKINKFNPNYSGNIYDYISAVNYSIQMPKTDYTKFRSLCPAWDNEARKPGRGTSFINSDPAIYARWLEYLLYDVTSNQKNDEKIIFINAWNEWAEGAYLEPDRHYGYAYLNATYEQLKKFEKTRLLTLKNHQHHEKKSDTAVVLHLYFVELWDEIAKELEHFDFPFDLYVNINNNHFEATSRQILSKYPYANLYALENRGRDIYPFLTMMQDILPLKYNYLCKLHSKKSIHRKDGDKWRQHLIKSLIGSTVRIHKCKDLLNGKSGIVVARGNKYHYTQWIGSNKAMVKRFAERTKIEMCSDFYFPAGSMFWIKPEVLTPLVENFSQNFFTIENGETDGTKAHAIERIFGLLCKSAQLNISEI